MTKLQKTLVAGAVLVAAAAVFYQGHRVSALQEDIKSLREEHTRLVALNRQLQSEHDEAALQLTTAKEQLATYSSSNRLDEVLKLRGEVAELRRRLGAKEAKEGSVGGMAAMMKDPAMKDYMRQSQVTALHAQLAGLFKDLKLTPEQTDQVCSAMVDLMMKNIDSMYSIPQGSMSAADIARANADREAALADALRPIIGDEGVQRLQDFRNGCPAEATLALISGQLGGHQLNEDQISRLRQLVKAEPFDLTRGISGDWDPAFWGTQADIDRHLQAIADSNRHILDQASQFLDPDQLIALNTVLNNGVNDRINQAAAFIQKP